MKQTPDLPQPSPPKTATEDNVARTKGAFESLGIWDDRHPPKKWHHAAITFMNTIDGNGGGIDGEKAKLAFVLAKGFDDSVDRLESATMAIVAESKASSKKMSLLTTVMILVTVAYTIVTALGVYFARGQRPASGSNPTAAAVQATVGDRARYELDLTCSNGPGSFERCDPMQTEKCDDQTLRFSCYAPATFHIKCDRRTVQVLDDNKTYLCSTHDDKSVRIRISGS